MSEDRPQTSHWSDAFEPEAKGFLQNRGWHNLTAEAAVAEAVKAYQNAAKMVGAPPDEMVRLPKDTGAPEWNNLWKRLGKPDAPEAYDFSTLATPEKPLENGLVSALQGAAFRANLAPAQAHEVVDAFLKHQAETAKAASDAAGFQTQAERARLQQNWGAQFETNQFIASRAAANLGVTPEALAALEKATGYAAVMETFRKIGVASGEARFITGENPQAEGMMSAEQASLRISELKNDPVWVKAYLNGDAAKFREMSDLIRRSKGR